MTSGAAQSRAGAGDAAPPRAYRIAAADGRAIAAYSWPADAKALPVLGVHGLGDHGRALPYRLLAEALAGAGYRLVTYDQRGHGDVSPSAKGRAAWSDLRADLRAVHASLAAERGAAGAPPIVGLSMGALLALDDALAEGGRFPVVAAAAPLGAVRAAPLAALAARGLGAWLPGLNIGARFDPQWIAADAEAVRQYTGDPLFHRDLGAGLAAELLDAIERVHTAAGGLAQPLLLLHGTDDRFAPWDAGFARRAPRGRCTVRLFEGGRHNLFIDACRAQVFAAVIAHLQRRDGSGATAAARRPGGRRPLRPAADRARHWRCAGEAAESPLRLCCPPMPTTQYYTAASLDGFIATEDHSLDWLFQLGDVNDTSYPEFIRDVGALAMGASTYEWMLHHVVKLGSGAEQPWPYGQPTWVFGSRPLPRVAGADLRLVRGDVRPVHREMVAAAQGRNVWLVGGGELVGQFHDAGLLDELIVQVGSVTLGSGRPLLPRRIAFPPLRLTSARAVGTGFAELRYAVPRPA